MRYFPTHYVIESLVETMEPQAVERTQPWHVDTADHHAIWRFTARDAGRARQIASMWMVWPRSSLGSVFREGEVP